MDSGTLSLHGAGVGGLVKLFRSWVHPWQGGWGPPVFPAVQPLSLLGKKLPLGWSVWDEKGQIVNPQTP